MKEIGSKKKEKMGCKVANLEKKILVETSRKHYGSLPTLRAAKRAEVYRAKKTAVQLAARLALPRSRTGLSFYADLRLCLGALAFAS